MSCWLVPLGITPTLGKCLFGHSSSSQKPLQRLSVTLIPAVPEPDLQWTNIEFRKISAEKEIFNIHWDCWSPRCGERRYDQRCVGSSGFSWFYTDRSSCGGRRSHAESSHDTGHQWDTNSLESHTLTHTHCQNNHKGPNRAEKNITNSHLDTFYDATFFSQFFPHFWLSLMIWLM